VARTNSYKEHQTPWQIVHQRAPNVRPQIVALPPVYLDDLFACMPNYAPAGGHDVVPWPSRPHRLATLRLTTSLHAFCHAYLTLLTPLYLALQKGFDLPGVAGATLLVSAQGVAFCLGSLPVGLLADRVSRKRLLTIGLLLNGLAFAALSRADSYWMAVACLFAAGLAGSFYHPAAMGLLVALADGRPGKFIGIAGMGAAVGFFVGPTFGGFRAEAAGWRAPCLELGLLGALWAVVYELVARDAPATVRRAGGGTSKLPRAYLRSVLWYFGLVSLVFAMRDFAATGVGTLSSLFLQKAHEYRLGPTGLFLGLMCLSSLLANPLFGSLSDGTHRLRWLGGLLLAAAVATAAIPWMPRALVLIALVAYGIPVMASYAVGEAALAESVPDEVRGTMFGGFLTVAGVLGSIAPWAMGRLSDALGSQATHVSAYGPVYAGLAALLALSTLGVPVLNWVRTREVLQQFERPEQERGSASPS